MRPEALDLPPKPRQCMQSMNKMRDAMRGASSQTKSAEEDTIMDATSPRASFNHAIGAANGASKRRNYGDSTPQRSPRSQAAIDKCMASLENCKAVLAQSAENGSSDACHDDDLLLRELALLASQAQGSLLLASGSPCALRKSPTYIPRGVASDMLRWDDSAVVAETSSGVVKEKLRDVSWEAQGGGPRVFRKTPYRWLTPSVEMLLEVEARGC